jgi:hypothetical protein
MRGRSVNSLAVCGGCKFRIEPNQPLGISPRVPPTEPHANAWRLMSRLLLTDFSRPRYKPAMPQVPLQLPDLDLGEIPVLACSWLAEQGSRVVQGDRLLEVVAGEVCVDLEAPASGRLVQRCVGPEDVLSVGQVLGVIVTS